jgi:hypothetical protein
MTSIASFEFATNANGTFVWPEIRGHRAVLEIAILANPTTAGTATVTVGHADSFGNFVPLLDAPNGAAVVLTASAALEVTVPPSRRFALQVADLGSGHSVWLKASPRT